MNVLNHPCAVHAPAALSHQWQEKVQSARNQMREKEASPISANSRLQQMALDRLCHFFWTSLTKRGGSALG